MSTEPNKTEGPEANRPSAASGTHERVRSSGAAGPLPASVGRYRVLCELGRGGMGVVYRVHDPGSGQELALKQLLVREGAGSHAQQAASLFEREYHTLAQLAHPRVIAVYDYGFDPAGPYYTMELLDGGDLKALAPLDVARACRLMLELCSSLALLHARRLVHRDVSPRNVRCTHDGHAKLIDFGAMVPMGPCTHTVGTPAFVAPEVLHRSNIDARTDLFSLGATLYYLLTGRPPYAVRQFSELRDAWAAELVLPSQLVPNIPPALDALCASLLRIDPAQRPRSAFEVMQRLQAIAGIELDEPLEVRRAYLTAPALIGRDAPLRLFRQRMRRALHRDGSALAFESAPGLGRSRMLDACALEAKTLGATVLRAAASASAERAFAVAEHLCAQLLSALPEAAVAAAHEAKVHELLFAADEAGSPRLHPFTAGKLERAALQDALDRWLRAVSKTHALLIAIDDAPRVDEPSIALCAGLALSARELRVLVAITSDGSSGKRVPAAFNVLAQHCLHTALAPLSALETEALLLSVFGHVPNLSLLADRLHSVALGSPRATLELAQNLVDRGLIRYEHGQWTLPGALAPSDLPESATEALSARIAALPALARHLADAQALLGCNVLRREDYAALAPQASASELDAALLTLLEREIVQSDGTFYSLSHRALADCLRAQLDPEHERALHVALFEHAQRGPDSHPYLTIHHLFAAGRDDQALDLLAVCPIDDAARDAAMRGDPVRLSANLEHALELCLQRGRPAREVHELRRRLCTLAVVTDDSLYARVAAPHLAQLEIDSGLNDYRALDPALDPGARLQQALTAAMTRYGQLPEHERVYRVDEAIKNLCVFAVMSIVVGSRTHDVALLESLPPLVEPFVALSPALNAIWHNVIATNDMIHRGRLLEARRRWTEVYEQLGQLQGDSLQYVREIRYAVAHALANLAARMGHAQAFDWAHVLDQEPLQQVAAMDSRRITRIMQGDAAGAERYAREGELLALRASARGMFERTWVVELNASVLSHDLDGVKRVIDGIIPLAARHVGWVPLLHAADGQFQLLRGDLAAARAAFERSIELVSPDRSKAPSIEVWIIASAGLVRTLVELGQVAQAIELGTRALERSHALGVTIVWYDLACALALAELRDGRTDAACTRIDALIAEQRELGIGGLILAASYEARARIAIAARDADGAARYAAQALRERGGRGTPAGAAHAERLLESARHAGLDVSLAPSEFEHSVRGTVRTLAPDPLAIKIGAELETCGNAAARAARALALLCEAADAASGRLYLADAEARLTQAASSQGLPPDTDLDAFARNFIAQQLDEDEMTAGLTQATHMLSLPGAASWVDGNGGEHRVLLLSCKQRGVLVYVGVAVLAASKSPRVAPETLAYSTFIAQHLLHAGDAQGANSAAAVKRTSE